MTLDTFPARLRLARIEASLSQTELAMRLNWNQSRISALERGRWVATSETVVKIAEVLKCEPNDLDPTLVQATAWIRP